MREQGLTGREMTVVLVSDGAIAERNLRDRGVDGPTDVLSYPTFEPSDVGYPEVTHLGDVFVSLDTAKRQARAAGRKLGSEVAALAAHGLIHLTGKDHTSQAAWRPFTAAQERAAGLFEADLVAGGAR